MHILTTEAILKQSPCAEGLAVWNREFPEGRLEWSLDGQIKFILSDCRQYLGWIFSRRLAPIWSLSGVNLSGVDLRGVDLRGVDLRGVDLRGVGLSGARLSRANLSGANLSRANLFRADLSGADLSEARLPAGFKRPE